jgi:hypothetical protein
MSNRIADIISIKAECGDYYPRFPSIERFSHEYTRGFSYPSDMALGVRSSGGL